jgi:Methyltransferase domain
MGLNYLLRHPARAVAAVVVDPVEAWTTVLDRYVYRQERKRPQWHYKADVDWEQRLHRFLGVPWPCTATEEFHAVLPRVMDSLTAMGIRVGPESFGTWNDGDVGLVRAIYCLARHLRPENVVETGVAHGVTSRFILEAMASNGVGHLWSIDLPPEDPKLQAEIGVAVGKLYPHLWTYIKGSSRRRLPALLARLRKIDLFIHDSLHSERNVCFEVDRALAALRDGGAIVVDDIDANYGFHSLMEKMPNNESVVCEAEPVRPDLRRFNHKGMFGIILKRSGA